MPEFDRTEGGDTAFVNVFEHAQKVAVDYVTYKMTEEIKYQMKHLGISISVLDKVYNPTGEFEESWENVDAEYEKGLSRRVGAFVKGYMGYNPDKIITIDKPNFIHGSNILNRDGTEVDITEALPYIVFGGESGDIFGDGFWTRPRDAWDKLIKRTNRSFGKWIKDGFAVSGIRLR